MMGLPMDFTVLVTKWEEGRKKVRETIGPAKMILYSWYQMRLKVHEQNNKTMACLSITYKKPEGFLNRLMSFFFADWYCRWCLGRMLADGRRALESKHMELVSA
jgi:hypothetical protein